MAEHRPRSEPELQGEEKRGLDPRHAGGEERAPAVRREAEETRAAEREWATRRAAEREAGADPDPRKP